MSRLAVVPVDERLIRLVRTEAPAPKPNMLVVFSTNNIELTGTDVVVAVLVDPTFGPSKTKLDAVLEVLRYGTVLKNVEVFPAPYQKLFMRATMRVHSVFNVRREMNELANVLAAHFTTTAGAEELNIEEQVRRAFA